MFVCVSGLGLWVVVVGKSLQLLLGCVPNEFIFLLMPRFPHVNQEDKVLSTRALKMGRNQNIIK